MFHPSNSCTFPLLLDKQTPVKMPEIGDVEENADADVEVVEVEGDEAVLAHRLQTICEAHKWQEEEEAWHLQG